MLSALRHVRRFSRLPTLAPQNVAEHSYYVAVLAGCFATQVQRRGVAVDRGALLEGALWHDAAEAFTGDLPHDVKRLSRELHGLWSTMEGHVQDQIVALNGGPLAGLTPVETALVKVADWVELLLYVQSESDLGNRALGVTVQRIWALMTAGGFSHDAALGGWYEGLLAELTAAGVAPTAGPTLRRDPLSILQGDDLL